MIVRITGTEEDRKTILAALGSYQNENGEPLKILSVSKEYDYHEDKRMKSVYVDIPSKFQIVIGNLQDYQVLEYCYNFRSKNQLAKEFHITWDAAGEILDRLANSGDLIKMVSDKRYEYIRADVAKLVVKECGNCDHRTISWGECEYDPEPDTREHGYIPVHNAACPNFTASFSALARAANGNKSLDVE